MTTVALSAEQSMLVTTTEHMVADHPTRNEAEIEHERATGTLWSVLVANGFIELAVRKEGPTTGEPTLNASLVMEQLARGLSAAPYLGTLLALGLLEASQVRGAHSAEILGGRPGCVILDSSLSAPATEGIAVDAVSGALVIGTDGHVVCASVLGEQLDALDPSRLLATVLGPVNELGAIAPQLMVRWRAQALALLCADLVGTCEAALEGAVAHARDREQFGRPIGSFQAVQHLCADQLVSIEAARSITWRAAWAVDALAPDEALAAAQVAKAYCSEMARTVCEAAIQVWGGLGMTWECPAHRYLRRALQDRQLLSNERDLLVAIARRRLGPDQCEAP
jgi:alkylation response protein AidB-like acyl-CoA dehydrogenase